MKLFKQLYITNLLIWILLSISLCFIISLWIPMMMMITQYLFLGVFIFVILEIFMFFDKKHKIKVERNYPEKLSNGDNNPLQITIKNTYPFDIKIEVIEEIPANFQIRTFFYKLKLEKNATKTIEYSLRPTKRGIYTFGNCYVFVTKFNLIKRRLTTLTPISLTCYPSFIQLKKYMLMASTNRLNEIGVKKIRKIGNTLEFDHVRNYNLGDEFRRINWKASAKNHRLMSNHYEDEKSQPIYALIDTSRAMRMPFEEMTLLDYAINATLVLSNTTIQKHDKAGMLTFDKQIENFVVADKRNHQMQLITEKLYNIKTNFEESDFGNIYAFAKKNISQRALLFIYTNFETLDAMNRQLQYLKLLKKSHIIVIVIFKNTEIVALSNQKATHPFDIYKQVISEKFLYEKQLIVQELERNGIQTLYTKPEDLTVNSINKYLEIKARGLI